MLRSNCERNPRLSQSQPMSAFDIAADGWQTGMNILFRSPQLFVSAFVLILLIDGGMKYLTMGPDANFGSPGNLSNLSSSLITGIIRTVLEYAVLSSVLVAVHRQVLLQESTDHPVWQLPPTFTRFFLWMLALMVIMTIPLLALPVLAIGIAGSISATVFGTLLLFGLAVVELVIALRSMMLFPALAVAAPGATWRGAWQDSQGKMLRILGTFFLAMLPVLGFVIVASIVGALTLGRDRLTGIDNAPGAFSIAMFLTNALTLVAASVGAVVASRLFQSHANVLTRPGA